MIKYRFFLSLHPFKGIFVVPASGRQTGKRWFTYSRHWGGLTWRLGEMFLNNQRKYGLDPHLVKCELTEIGARRKGLPKNWRELLNEATTIQQQNA